MIRQISINFNTGVIETWPGVFNNGPDTCIMIGSPTIDDLLETVIIQEHMYHQMKDMTREQLVENWKNTPCNHPDCPDHPDTWGKTKEQLDKELNSMSSEEKMLKYYNFDVKEISWLKDFSRDRKKKK